MTLLRIRLFLFVGAFGALSSDPLSAASKAEAVTVEIAPATLERRSFNPKKPPREMPKLIPPGKALCFFRIYCGVEIDGGIQDTSVEDAVAVVSALRFEIWMTITIWLPTKYTRKMEIHEEAHRKICDHYYAFAEAAARDLGEKTIGTPLPGSITDQRAMRDAMGKHQRRLIEAFMRRITDRCYFAQNRFDDLTKHGANKLPEEEAIRQAIALEQAAPDEAIPVLHSDLGDGGLLRR